jgi:hypothetical protein
MSRRRILIVGGSDAGIAAALSARSIDPECRRRGARRPVSQLQRVRAAVPAQRPGRRFAIPGAPVGERVCGAPDRRSQRVARGQRGSGQPRANSSRPVRPTSLKNLARATSDAIRTRSRTRSPRYHDHGVWVLNVMDDNFLPLAAESALAWTRALGGALRQREVERIAFSLQLRADVCVPEVVGALAELGLAPAYARSPAAHRRSRRQRVFRVCSAPRAAGGRRALPELPLCRSANGSAG